MAGSLFDALHEVRNRQRVLTACLALCVHRRLEEFHGGNTWNLDRVLERQEQARSSALIRLHLKKVLSVEQDLAFGNLVVVLAGQDVGQRRLAGTVRAHDGVYFACIDGQIDAAQDLCFVFRNAGMQVFDLKH